MEKTKRILALLLSAALTLGLCPLFADAAPVYISDVIGTVASLSDEGNDTINGVLIDVNGRPGVLTAGWFYDENAEYRFYGSHSDGDALTLGKLADDRSFVLFYFADGHTDDTRLYIHNTPMPEPGDQTAIYYYDTSGIEYIEDLGNAEMGYTEDTVSELYKGFFFLNDGVSEDAYGALIIVGSNGMGFQCAWAADEYFEDVLYSDVCLSFYAVAEALGLHQKYYMGDANLDGSVTAADARLILRNAVGLEALDRSQLLLADMDFSGDVSAADARMALRTAVGLEELQTY